MASQAKIEDIERRIAVCQEYARLWEDFFKCFGTGDLQQFQARKILDQDEARFAKIITELARQAFRFGFFMGDKFGDGEKLIDILERAENLKTIQQMADANFSKLEVDWHQVFIAMHRAVGRLMRELPPPELEEEEEADAKGKKGKKKGGGPAKSGPRPTAQPITSIRLSTGAQASGEATLSNPSKPSAPGAPRPAAPGARPAAPGAPKMGAPAPPRLKRP